MAIVVVGGGGRGAGKTALVCGVIAALPERCWIAVKIAGHTHGAEQQVYEESESGESKDTARYLAAGAQRAFLLTAGDDDAMKTALFELWAKVAGVSNFIFESNRALSFLNPDVCLVLARDAETKASYRTALRRANAIVTHLESSGLRNSFEAETWPVFELERFDQLPRELANWIRGRLVYG